MPKRTSWGKYLSTKNISRNLCCPCSHSLLHVSNPFHLRSPGWFQQTTCAVRKVTGSDPISKSIELRSSTGKKSQLFRGWQSRSGGSAWPRGIYYPELTLPDCWWVILAAAPDAGEDVPVPQLQELTAQCLPFNTSPGFGAASGTSGASRMQAKAPTGAGSWGWGAVTP